MADEFDVIVLGLGTCGEDLAIRLLDGGLSVAGIEERLVGGECAYWACIPTKMMIRAANLIHAARGVAGVAGSAEVTPDWSPVAQRIRTEATGDWDDSIAVERFRSRGGSFHRGRGKLVDHRTVSVGEELLTARRGIVIATGSAPFIPPIEGLDQTPYWTTHDAIKATHIPESMIILGGGAVGCELGQVFRRFGSEVTIVEAQDHLLPAEEAEASTVIEEAFRSEGIAVLTGRRVIAVRSSDDKIQVEADDGSIRTAQRLLVAVGRKPRLHGVGLEAVGVDPAGGRIPADGDLRVADGVWAMGDATASGMFTHVAVYQSSIVAADLLGERHPQADYRALPRATFTDPEVGSVGVSEAQAREAGLDVAVVVKQVPATFRGWINGPGADGVIKLVVDRGSDTLAGATVVGPSGGEVLGMLTTAVHGKVPLEVMRSMIYAFPTFHGGIGEAIGAYARGIGQVIEPGFEPLLG